MPCSYHVSKLELRKPPSRYSNDGAKDGCVYQQVIPIIPQTISQTHIAFNDATAN